VDCHVVFEAESQQQTDRSLISILQTGNNNHN